MEFLGDRRPADHGAPLEHGDLQARRRQIGRAHQPVVPAADDQCIAAPALARQPWLQPRAGACGSGLSGMRLRMRRAKLRRHTSPSLNGPEV